MGFFWVKMTLSLNKILCPLRRKGPLLLIIMDGIGIGKNNEANAVYLANTPTLDKLFSSKFFCTLQAHGKAVGLPTDKDMGNSEVGHNAIGAGRVVDQGAKLVNKAIESGKIFKSKHWHLIVKRAKKGGTVHFLGLLSDGNVHSHINHLYCLVDKCAELMIKRVRIHALLDGRDVDEKSALKYIIPTEKKLIEISKTKGLDYRIASGGGRMKITMDRYGADWDMVKRGWETHVLGKARPFHSAEEAIKTFYKENPDLIDQYIDPFVIVNEKGEPVGPIKDGDSVICFNFRGDRVIEISRAFIEKDFYEFDRGPLPDVYYVGMMEYDGDKHIPPNYLVEPPIIENTISEYLCAEGIKSFAIAETQKFGHVTYFWNGNRSGYIDEKLEKYVEIPSDNIEFDKKPEMKAFEVKEKTIELLKSGEYKFGRVNFANGDMVGHTGNLEASITAVETVDKCVSDLVSIIEEIDGIAVVTADHGNVDEMFTYDKHENKIPKTSHTLNPVPFVIWDPSYNNEYYWAFLKKKGLSNIAATILNLLGYEKPQEYDPSLINFNKGG